VVVVVVVIVVVVMVVVVVNTSEFSYSSNGSVDCGVSGNLVLISNVNSGISGE
jgi:hypothetical protein